jgi:pSer/pThr/pTyr-binding forkhead associated (FHA) protein
VSRRHARIVVTGDATVLEDLGSKNGTFLHGERVTSPVRVTDGDEIHIGSLLVTFRVLALLLSTDTRAWPAR